VVSRTGALTGIEGPDNFLLNVDPARMAAGIVTGIGFLGAGAILRIRQSLVRGLTNAASIWFVAAIGVAVGLGAYSSRLWPSCWPWVSSRCSTAWSASSPLRSTAR
jgi:putative Mg2+ transporter-C (MgtC) family protein